MPNYKIEYHLTGVETIHAETLQEALDMVAEMDPCELAQSAGMEVMQVDRYRPISSHSIGDDDLCASCQHCARSFTDDPSRCEEGWPGMENEYGNISVCLCWKGIEGGYDESE